MEVMGRKGMGKEREGILKTGAGTFRLLLLIYASIAELVNDYCKLLTAEVCRIRSHSINSSTRFRTVPRGNVGSDKPG